MKKFTIGSVLFFVIYVMCSWLYIYIWSDTAIPTEYLGTAADPVTFMDAERYSLSQSYSKLMNFIYLAMIPVEWGMYIGILLFGISRRFREWTKRITRLDWLQTVVFVLLISLTSFAVFFPIQILRYFISRSYDISIQPFSSWITDRAIQFSLDWLIMTVVVLTIYYLIRKNMKRWWIYTWVLSIPFIILMFYIQPVLIDPLYNDYVPLQDHQLEAKILTLAAEANIPADRVYEVNMSAKTNALNAYVNGIGGSLRIVLWDTTLQQLNDEEILFIMAHEMGHYVMNHLNWVVFGMIVLSFFALLLIHLVFKQLITRWGKLWGTSHMRDVSTLPALLLIFSLLMFIANPISNAISRESERAADRYALQLTGNPHAAVSAYQKMASAGLSGVNPPTVIKVLRYTHPSIMERIVEAEKFKKQRHQRENGQDTSLYLKFSSKHHLLRFANNIE